LLTPTYPRSKADERRKFCWRSSLGLDITHKNKLGIFKLHLYLTVLI
jgi:hypothetical protein